MLFTLQGRMEINPFLSILKIAREMNNKIFIAIGCIFSIAITIIKQTQISDNEIHTIKPFKGVTKSTDIIINAIVDGKTPDDLHNDSDSLLISATIISKIIIQKTGKEAQMTKKKVVKKKLSKRQ